MGLEDIFFPDKETLEKRRKKHLKWVIPLMVILAISLIIVIFIGMKQSYEIRKNNPKTDTQKSLELLKERLEENQQMTLKLDECTKACAKEDYNIPAIRNDWYNVCYQLYYNLGLEEVDKQIADCKSE